MHSSAPSLQTLRIIVIGMIVGSCVIGGTVLFSASRIGAKAFIHPAIGYTIGGLAVASMFAQTFLVPKLFRAKRSETEDRVVLLNLFATETLIRASLLEAVALLAYLSYLFTLDDKILVVGLLLVGMIAMLIPTQASFDRWCARA